MSLNDRASQTTSQQVASAVTDLVRVNLNALIQDAIWGLLNRPAWNVSTAAVAPPVCNTATVTSQVKTTATTQLYVNGVVTSLTATDPLWTLTGGNLAAGFVRKYLLLWDATTATTVATVLQCLTDQPIVTTAAAALALCRFPGSPPVNALGIAPAVVGVLSITNLTNPFIPGTTLLGATGVTAAYRDGPDVNSFIASITTP